MVAYRSVPDARLDEFADIWSYAYQQLDDHVTPAETERRIEPARVGEQRGIFDGDELVAICRHHMLQTSVRNATQPIGCLASVATPPEHRRKGYVRELIESFLDEYRDRAIPLSALWAFEYPFYDRFGWELANRYAVRECQPAALAFAREHATGEFVQLTPDAHERLASVLAAHNTSYDLTIERTEDWWRERVFQSRGHDPHVYGWESNGELRGYLVYTVSPNDEVTIDVSEMAYADHTAYLNLLRFLANHQSQAQRVRLYGPVDDSLMDLVDDPASIETTIHPGPSVRVVDVETVLEAIEYPTGVTGSTVLLVDDPIADWNDQAFRIDIADGVATVEPTRNTTDARIAIGALTQLVVGYRTADELVVADELAVDDAQTQALLAEAFPSRSVFLREKF